jgi:hypothetical protein
MVVEAATFEELVDLIGSLAPEVIAANVPDAPTPYRVQIVTRRELAFAAESASSSSRARKVGTPRTKY